MRFNFLKQSSPLGDGNLSKPAKMHLFFPALVMLVVGFLCWNMVEDYYHNLLLNEKSELQTHTDEIASYLTSEINSRQSMLKGLGAMVQAHLKDGLPQAEFQTFASGLKANDPSIRVIQYFPLKGPVMLYPVEGNEAVVGSTLDQLKAFPRPGVSADVQRAIETRRITLSDPYQLTQGGAGIVARQAVYDHDKFLGLVVIVLNQDALLDIPGLSPAPTDIRYALRDTNGRTFYGDEQVFFLQPVQAIITLPEGHWTLGGVPIKGWINSFAATLALACGVSVFVTLLAGYLAYLFFNNQMLLKKTVAERTAALRESEDRYVQTFKVINEGVWDWNDKSGIRFASDSLFSILGIEKTNIKGFEQWESMFYPEDIERVTGQISTYIKSGKGFNIETHVRRRNGTTINVLIRGQVVERDANGKVQRVLGTLSDITEKMQSEQNLRESEAKFRAIFNNSHAVMLLIDPDPGKIIDANPAACSFYGYSFEKLTSLSVPDLNISNPEEIAAAMQEAVKTNQSFFNFRHRLSNGEIRDVEIFSGPIVQHGKNYLFSIVHDVTARRQFEKALMDNENRLRFALEGANDGLWDVQMKTGEVYMSPRGCQILGYSNGDLAQVIKVWNQLVHPADMAETQRKLDEHIAGRSEIFEVEQRLHMKSGDWKWVLTRGKLVERDENGQPLRMTGTHTDITQRKQTEEKMNAAQQELKILLAEADASRQVLLSMLEDQKAAEEKLYLLNIDLENRVRERTIQLETTNNELEAFSYSVSHDLRAPLRGIDGWSQALLEDYGDRIDEKGQVYLQRVRSETQRMGDLIDDLLRLSRVTRMELKQAPIDLSEQAFAIVERLREEFKQKPPEFIIQPGVHALGDRQLLDIVLTNLLSNACKFSSTQSAPRVEFGQTDLDGTRVFFVRDNGVGFDGANSKKLFRAFQRLHRQSEFPGTGIGLATVKRVISRHGGQVWAESQIARGATFFFTLPEVR